MGFFLKISNFAGFFPQNFKFRTPGIMSKLSKPVPIDGWMDGWMDRWMDGWMDGWMWMDGWVGGWMEICSKILHNTVAGGSLSWWTLIILFGRANNKGADETPISGFFAEALKSFKLLNFQFEELQVCPRKKKVSPQNLLHCLPYLLPLDCPNGWKSLMILL